MLDQSNLAGALQAFRQQRQQRQNGPGFGQRFPQPAPAPTGGYDGSGINPGAGAPRTPGGFGAGALQPPAIPPTGGPAPLAGQSRPAMGAPAPRSAPRFQRPEAMGAAVPADSNPILIRNMQPKAMAL